MNDKHIEAYWTAVRLRTPPPTRKEPKQVVKLLEIMTTEELLWILIGINSVSFLYFYRRHTLHGRVVKKIVEEQPNLTNKPKRK